MTTPIPTPFDIIDPPPGPFIPSLHTWLWLAIATALGATLAWWLSNRQKRRSTASAVQELVAELRRINSTAMPSAGAERITRIAKRILAAFMTADPAGLSPVELRVLASSMGAAPDECTRSASSILALVAEVEELTYSPNCSDPVCQPIIHNLVSDLENHVRRYRPL